MEKEKLIIEPKTNSGYRTFSIRLPENMIAQLDTVAGKSNRSRTEIITMLLAYALKNCEIGKKESE